MARKPPLPIQITNEKAEAIAELSPTLFKDLSIEESVFLREYIKDGNASQAAIRCGITEENSRSHGYRQLQKSHVQKAHDQIVEAIKKKLGWSVEKSAINIQKYMNEARERGQYMAVVGFQRHLDEITKVYQPGLKIDLTQKASFTVQMVGFKPPSYASEEIDVTPKPQLEEPKPESDDESTEEQ